MRMIRLLLITLIACTFSFRATADDVEFDKYSRMIPYEQFLKLDPDTQHAYVEGLRLLVLEMEMYQENRAKIDPKLRRRVNAYFDFIAKFVPRAKAAGGVCFGPSLLLRPEFRNQRCSTRMSFPETKKYCPYPPTSSDPLFRFSGPLQSRWDRNLTDAAARRARRVPAAASSRTAVAPANGTARSNSRRTTAAAAADSAGAAPARAVVTSTASELAAVAEARLCIEEGAAAPARTGLVCDRESIDAARLNFTGSGKTCLYAGHLRKYKNDSAQPGKCEPIHQWCISDEPENCQDPTDSAHRVQTAFRCRPSEVLCNPLLFGLKKAARANRFEAFCVPKAGAATKACYQLSANEPTRVEIPYFKAPKDADGNDRKYFGDYEGWSETEHDAVVQQYSQIPKIWNELAEGLTDMCLKNEVKRQVFCEECYYIRLRLRELSALSSNDANSLCGIVQPWNPGPAVATVPGNQATPTQPVPALAADTQRAPQLAPAPGAVPAAGSATNR